MVGAGRGEVSWQMLSRLVVAFELTGFHAAEIALAAAPVDSDA